VDRPQLAGDLAELFLGVDFDIGHLGSVPFLPEA